MAWEPDRRSNFFFSPPAHLCAVTYMTEISLIVTLNNQFNSTQLNSSNVRLLASRSLQVKTNSQNDWSVTNQIEYTGLRQDSYLVFICMLFLS